jgi:hypothetical protein
MSLSFEQALSEVNWEELEEQHRIVITGNMANVFARRLLGPDKLLFTAVAFLGTKAIDLEIADPKWWGGAHYLNSMSRETDRDERSVGTTGALYGLSGSVGHGSEGSRGRIDALEGAAF